MRNHLNLFIFTILLIFSLNAASAVKQFTEADLLTWSKESSPKLDEIQANLLSSQTQAGTTEEEYAPELFGQASYSETQERPIIQFLPVFSPVKLAQLGVRKKFGGGFQASVQAAADQRSAVSPVSGRYDNVTTTVVGLTLQMDLWKDLFGRISKAERENASLETKRSTLESEISSKAFAISLRRIYWNLVATEEQLKISKRLLVTASEQVADAKKKLKNSIGDAGEVARYTAQYASRQGQVIVLTYQKENLLKQLKTFLPQLGKEELVLAPYDLELTQKEVIECSGVIIKEAEIPYNFTKYDEVVGILRDLKSSKKSINERFSDVDVKLFGTLKSTGVGSDQVNPTYYRGSYGNAYDDMRNNNRSGYEVGVNVVLPLGDAKEKLERTKTLYDEKRFRAQISQAESQVVSTHTQLAKSMGLIQEVIETQRLGTASLDKRLQVIRKKFTQARVSVNDLILDQDALLNSELSTIDSQMQAMNVLFDYFMIFTDTPCAFNRN